MRPRKTTSALPLLVLAHAELACRICLGARSTCPSPAAARRHNIWLGAPGRVRNLWAAFRRASGTRPAERPPNKWLGPARRPTTSPGRGGGGAPALLTRESERARAPGRLEGGPVALTPALWAPPPEVV